MSFLAIDNVGKDFASTKVLEDIDISIEKGEFLVLVGPSGCGKSTLLNLIAGLEDVTRGSISIGGRDVTQVPPADRDIAMVFQSYALYPNMTVAGNITFALEMRGVPKAERTRACEQVAETLQISHLLKRKPGQLSGGQRQRVAMGRALVRNPQVFLFDEPLSNLDAKLRVDMRTEIKQLHQNLGTTIVYVTHDQIEAMTLADRIAVMQGGVIEQLGTPNEIYGSPRNLFVASFMGSPSMNLVDGEVDASGGMVRLADEENLRTLSRSVRPGPVKVGVRAESFVESAPTDTSWGFTSTVELVEPSGSDTYVIVQLAGQSVTARMRGDLEVRAGDQLDLFVDPTRLHLFDAESGDRL